MGDPLVDPGDLAVVLNDPSINTERAMAVIVDAQTLCEAVVSPLPTAASVVVKRVAARGYVTATSSRAAQLQSAGSPFGIQPATGSVGGVWLTRADKADLRRISGGGGAFSIDILPTGYTAPTSWNVDPADLSVGPGDFGTGSDDWDSP